jgi:integrase/recombinase XerD
MILSEAIDKYVRRRQACGFLFAAGEKILYSFCNRVGNISLDFVSARDVQAFLDGPRTSRATWRSKYGLLKRFFESWHIEETVSKVPMPLPRPPERRTFTPYIFTRAEIRSLLTATSECQKPRICEMDASTFRCLLLTLYGTGALIGELLNLRVGDISFRRRKIVLSGNRVIESRTIPICPDLLKALKIFAALKHKSRKGDRHFFCTKDDRPLTDPIVRVRFMHLRKLATVERHDGAFYQPRMLDLRSTFAVHRITSWIKERADLNRMLPALAAYMGISSLVTTEQYLALTPERYRRQLRKLSPQRGQRHWRDDPALMKFLGSL